VLQSWQKEFSYGVGILACNAMAAACLFKQTGYSPQGLEGSV
jgi:hypothetical protein